jgi:hypothetical protein
VQNSRSVQYDHDFNLDDASEQAYLAFCELYNTPEFQSGTSFRAQNSVAVDYTRIDDLSISFSQTAGIFTVSKETVASASSYCLPTQATHCNPVTSVCSPQ